MGSLFQASLGKNLERPYLDKKAGPGGFISIIPATQEVSVGEVRNEFSTRQKCETLSEKELNQKMSRLMALVHACLTRTRPLVQTFLLPDKIKS
jgi:hypothetical protein